MAGNAARRAGEAIAAKLVAAASRITGSAAEGFVLRDEHVVYAPDPSISVPYLEAVHEAMAENGALIAKGIYQQPPPMGGSFKGAAAGLAPSYSFQAYVTRVRVDPETGFIRVEKVWAAHDCGKALNPMIVEGQVEGSIHISNIRLICPRCQKRTRARGVKRADKKRVRVCRKCGEEL